MDLDTGSENFCLQGSFFKILIWLKYLLYLLCNYFFKSHVCLFSIQLKDANLKQKKYNILSNVHRQDLYELQNSWKWYLMYWVPCLIFFSLRRWWTKTWSQWRLFVLSGGKICCRYLECSFLLYLLPNYEQYEEPGQKNFKISTRERKERHCIGNLRYRQQGRICVGLLFTLSLSHFSCEQPDGASLLLPILHLGRAAVV